VSRESQNVAEVAQAEAEAEAEADCRSRENLRAAFGLPERPSGYGGPFGGAIGFGEEPWDLVEQWQSLPQKWALRPPYTITTSYWAHPPADRDYGIYSLYVRDDNYDDFLLAYLKAAADHQTHGTPLPPFADWLADWATSIRQAA